MVNPKYARAYTEILEIIKYFPKEEYDKISPEKINFYKQNMDKNYMFTINPELDLSEQNISAETNAIIVNLFTDYFATEEQKTKIKEILDLNQKRLEEEKRKRYNPDNIYINTKNNHVSISEATTNTQLVEYKISFFKRFKNFILKIIHINKD